MNYEDITDPKIKGIIDGLKYNSATIESDIQQALDNAENEEDFKLESEAFLDNLHEEIDDIRKELELKQDTTDLIIYMEGGVIQDIKGIPEDLNVKVVDDIQTTPRYWDCECKHNYIHSRDGDDDYCPNCGTYLEDQPDSKVIEVIAAGLRLSVLPNS